LWYHHPSQHIKVVGITGTKGKSTVVALLDHLYSGAGHKTAMLSSVFVKIGDKKILNRTGNTMPGRVYIQRFISQAVKAECDVVFVEVTSQGVMQHRHRFIDWDKVVFLDIHPEHIEAHGSFEKYLTAKVDLFSYVAAHATAPTFFVNDKDDHADAFVRAVNGHNLVLFSAEDVEERMVVPSSLEGAFNLINIAAATAIARSDGISKDNIERAIASFKGLVGRMEVVQETPFLCIVDYAHTPNSLESLYSFLKGKRASEQHKLIGVISSAGGGRDKWKRSQMGHTAAIYADVVIITNEDPYEEPPQEIMHAIRKGVDQVHKDTLVVYEIEDRAEAIKKAVAIASPGDVVVATGKGSEECIHQDGKKIPWSERAAFEQALQEKSRNH
jgi:UDP-N-acetylmuramoyl-L-alanyl-D-glutamate--2,6-diaminopimelate ligase